jgi:anti-sigma factor RsiW
MKWQCRRWRSALVDFAGGVLSEPDRDAVEQHLARCADCADTVIALREIPAELGPTIGEPGEEFWRHQRDEILRAVRRPAAQAISRRRSFGGRRVVTWAAPALAALAASLALLVGPRREAPVAPLAAPAAPAVEESLASLAEEPVLEVDELWSDESDPVGFADALADELGEAAEGV